MSRGLPRRQIAITRASVTSCAVIPALIDQPTTRRESAPAGRRGTAFYGSSKPYFDAALRRYRVLTGPPSPMSAFRGKADIPIRPARELCLP